MKGRRNLVVCLLICSALIWSPTAAADEPTAEELQQWLERFIEAWDDENEPRVSVDGCIINRMTRNRNDILNLRGAILPVEIISVDSERHATVRVRVQEPHSGNYAMSRECNASNRHCAGEKGQFSAERYIDCTIRYARSYFSSTDSLTGNKASQLQCALTTYAQQCNTDLEETPSRGFCS